MVGCTDRKCTWLVVRTAGVGGWCTGLGDLKEATDEKNGL